MTTATTAPRTPAPRQLRHHTRRVVCLLAAAVLCAVGAPGTAAAVAAPAAPEAQVPAVETTGVEGPAAAHLAEAKWITFTSRQQPLKPRGTNDPACRVDAAHPWPVVMLHGTAASFYQDYSALAPALVDEGWCVFGVDYGQGPEPKDGFGWQSMELSAGQVEETVRAAQATSGGQQVALVGFSQGATLARVWMDRFARPGEVAAYIGLAAPSRGGTFYGAAGLLDVLPQVVADEVASPALRELVAGSPLLTGLADEHDLQPGTRAFTVGTRFDEMMPERTNQPLLAHPGTHLWLQDVCDLDFGGHMYLPYNPATRTIVRTLLRQVVDHPVGHQERVGEDPAVARVRQLAAAGQLGCSPVVPGHVIPLISVVDNLRKLGVLPTPVEAVRYRLG
ncbi:lipase [Corynebacterium sp. 13CS0277]|uniref:esterase/lipase family protein n=1 Tax=Corynebacterium sp. 13CS0277 TaxID=2071994 RepID=UPI000D042FEF|nr:alpha/beta fold hydrolase [Corynebacterium sp. 13CS0277]PRQ12528.1 lipase [Corynebacterium sp. 13CS0277]